LHQRAGGHAAEPALLRRRRAQHPRLRRARGEPARGDHARRVFGRREERDHRQRRVRTLLRRRAVGRGGVRGHRQRVRRAPARLAHGRRCRRALALAGRPGARGRRARAGPPGLEVPALPQHRGAAVSTPRPADGHEARIAELRARRRARLRVLALRSVVLGTGVFLLAVLVLTWLLTTVGGRDVVLRQIVARLPAGTTLTWSRAEGPVSGPLTLHDVHFAMPRRRDPACVPTPEASCAMGTIRFDAALVVLDPALRPLLGRRLRLDALQVRGATLDLPRSDTPFELPRWPESLPGIAPPLALQ